MLNCKQHCCEGGSVFLLFKALWVHDLHFLPGICLPLFPVVHTARTETLLPTLPRSPGCSTLLWRKTSPLVVHSTNSGENPTAHSYSSPQQCFVFWRVAHWELSWPVHGCFSGTKQWLTPALCSQTLTCCHSETRLRLEREYASF